MTKLLYKQISNEGKDKMFLLEQLRSLQRAKQTPSAPGGQGQQRSSSYHPSRQPAQQVPDYPGRAFDRNQNASYNNEYPDAAGILRGTGFPPGLERAQRSSGPGMSEAVAIALRAREAAELEDQYDDTYPQP